MDISTQGGAIEINPTGPIASIDTHIKTKGAGKIYNEANTIIAADKSLCLAAGTGAVDFSLGTGVFKTPAGLNTVSGKQSLKTIATPVAAAGAAGGVAGAAQLGTANIVYISSDGNTKGVKLATGAAGDIIHVINTSGTAANLFAASGGTINGGSADVGCAIAASKGVTCFCSAADTWTVFDKPAHAGAAA